MAEPGRPQTPRALLRWQIVTAGIGLVIVAGFLVHSAGTYSTVLVAAGGGSYTEALVGGPRYINPVLAQGNQIDTDIASLVFSGLTTLDECGNVVPDLATTWVVSEDGRQYTFQLRDDAYWHDGVPLVAQDVAFTIQVIQSPDYPGLPSVARLWREVSVEVLGDRHIRFTLPEPYSPFLPYTNLGILPSHILEGLPVTELAKSQFNRVPVGTGPFMLVESDANHVILRPHPRHYGDRPYLDTIEFRFYRDLGEALRAHERGEVQGIAGITGEYLPEVGASERLDLYSAPIARLAMIFLNLESPNAPYLADRPVRQALLTGLDRQALISLAIDGRGLVAHAPYFVCSWALDPNGPVHEFDPAQAAALLEEAGWVDQDGDGVRDKDGQRLALTLAAPDERGSQAVAREIERQWSKLGVQVTVAALPFADLIDGQLQSRQFDAALVELSLEGDPDPYVFWHSTQMQGGQNYSSFIDKEADGLLEAARREWDPEKRGTMYHRFQEILARELPALPLYYPVYTYAVDEAVRGVHIGPVVRPEDRLRSLAQWYTNSRRMRLRQASLDSPSG